MFADTQFSDFVGWGMLGMLIAAIVSDIWGCMPASTRTTHRFIAILKAFCFVCS
jgi:hypothetical protein